MESASSGLLAGVNAVRAVCGAPELHLPEDTMVGALAAYISRGPASGKPGDFQPMGANFGILPPLETTERDKRKRYAALADRALNSLMICLETASGALSVC